MEKKPKVAENYFEIFSSSFSYALSVRSYPQGMNLCVERESESEIYHLYGNKCGNLYALSALSHISHNSLDFLISFWASSFLPHNCQFFVTFNFGNLSPKSKFSLKINKAVKSSLTRLLNTFVWLSGYLKW